MTLKFVISQVKENDNVTKLLRFICMRSLVQINNVLYFPYYNRKTQIET